MIEPTPETTTDPSASRPESDLATLTQQELVELFMSNPHLRVAQIPQLYAAGFEMNVALEADCPHCAHPWRDHTAYGVYEDLYDGGYIGCSHLEECGCLSTWGVPEATRQGIREQMAKMAAIKEANEAAKAPAPEPPPVETMAGRPVQDVHLPGEAPS